MIFGPNLPKMALREKCPNTELFLVRIFPISNWIRRNSSYLSVFSPNAGKYRPDETPYLDTFHTVWIFLVEKRKSEYHHWIPRIRIRYSTHIFTYKDVFTYKNKTVLNIRRMVKWGLSPVYFYTKIWIGWKIWTYQAIFSY